MLKKATLIITILFCTSAAMAQSKKDLEAIGQLIGCFDVSFNYAETFTNDTTIKKYAHPIDKRTVVEVVYPLESSQKKIVLQHILIAVDGTVIKHWREDWEYEKNTIWLYEKEKKWIKKTLPQNVVKGKWMQTVWEVDDAPRYQGVSNWVETNGQTFWLSTTDAPLPRREFTKRKDYNVLQRTNKIIVSAGGWMHEQDNKKIIRKDGQPDSLLAEEKGYNEYRRIEDGKCKEATKLWSKEKADFWKDVRDTWNELMANASSLQLQTKVNDKFLFETLDEAENKNLNGAERKQAIKAIILQYATAK